MLQTIKVNDKFYILSTDRQGKNPKVRGKGFEEEKQAQWTIDGVLNNTNSDPLDYELL
jgi:hypothetical protein